MTTPNPEREALLPCPFCGGTNTQVIPSTMWTGQRQSIISVTVRHWCERPEGQPQSAIDIKGRDEASAIASWNTRAQASAEDARDAERWRYTNAENNIWRREDSENPCSLLCVVLPYGADLSCRATRAAAIDTAMRESARKDSHE